MLTKRPISSTIVLTMELLRKILAILIGILILIGIVLLAKWVGDRVREKFFTKKTSVVQVIPPEDVPTESRSTGSNTATYSAIPTTGPNDILYVVVGMAGLVGVVVKRVTSGYFIGQK